MKITKRILSAVLCVLMIGSVLPLTTFAAYENTHTNTGNQIEDLIAVATTQIGYTEGNSTSQMGGTSGGSGNYTKYGAWYGINPGAWCAMFVSWCANQAGIPTTVVTKHASCDLGMQWFQNKGYWKWSPACGGTYTPKRGDIIYFRTNTNQVVDSTHVGIVYTSDSSKVYTIEGNASNKCQKKSYSLSSAYILGYGVPPYTTISYSTGTYKTTASELNMRSGASTSYGVLQTLSQGTVVTITAINGTWGQCTVNGITGWISMKYCTPYTANPTYTITFDPNGGTIDSGSVSSVQIKQNQYYSEVLSAIPSATRTGYTLSGWYCEKFNYTLTLGGQFVVAEDVTFEAVWAIRPGQYRVKTVQANSTLNLRNLPSSAESTVLTEIPNTTLINITAFSGDWGYTSYNGYEGWVSLAYCEYVGELPENDGQYTLTLDPDGGTMPAGYSTTYSFDVGQTLVSVIGGFPVPTKTDENGNKLDFYGWRWDQAGYDTSGYRWTDGWGTQPYYESFGDARFVADWVAHEHDYESVITTAATCITTGIKTYTCYGCGDSYTEDIAMTGHSYDSGVITTPATCSSAGVKTYTCANCSETKTESLPVTGHSYSYSNGKVSCAYCSVGYDGWFNDTYYCTNGTCASGVFKIGSDYYYAGTGNAVVKNATVSISDAEKNGYLGTGTYYVFDSEGRLITTGFVTHGSYTCYYDNLTLYTGFKQIGTYYYYFESDGNMARSQNIEIGSNTYGVEPGTYFFRADGRMYDSTATGSIETGEDGKLYYYEGGVLQKKGLYFHDGKYYYAGADGALVTDEVVFVYYTNNLLEKSYYWFGSDGALVTEEFYQRLSDGKYYYLNSGAVHMSGFCKIGNDYYMFHQTNKERYDNQELWVGDNSYGITPGYYTFGADGKMISPQLAMVTDGVETASVNFAVMSQANDTQALNTTPAVVLSSPGSEGDDDEE